MKLQPIKKIKTVQDKYDPSGIGTVIVFIHGMFYTLMSILMAVLHFFSLFNHV